MGILILALAGLLFFTGHVGAAIATLVAPIVLVVAVMVAFLLD